MSCFGKYEYVLFVCSFNWCLVYAICILGTILGVRNVAVNNSERQNSYFYAFYILAGELENKYFNKQIYNMQVLVRWRTTQEKG